MGDPVSGVVVRSLRVFPRMRVETFRAVFDGIAAEAWNLPGSDELVVGEFPFHGVAGESLLLWDGPVLAGSADQARAFFDGNVERHRSLQHRTIDATRAPKLPDAEFWPIIDGLGRRTWERIIHSAERMIAEHGEQFAIRWAQTAGLKALDLADVFERAGLPARDELNAIGATLAQGKEACSMVRADVTMFDPRWLADLSSLTIWIATGALQRLGPRDAWVHIETAFSARHREILERTDADTEQRQREHGIPPEDRGPFFRIARAVMKLGGEYRERLFLLADADDALDDPSQTVALAESLGGEVVAGPEFSTDSGLGGLFNVELFTIKRRSTAPPADYLAMHASTPE